MVIEVAHLHARFEQPVQCVAVFRQRNVEHGDLIAGPGLDPFQQADVAFGAGDQFGIDRIGQPQLMQRADTIGVAVEYVKMQTVPLNLFGFIHQSILIMLNLRHDHLIVAVMMAPTPWLFDLRTGHNTPCRPHKQ